MSASLLPTTGVWPTTPAEVDALRAVVIAVQRDSIRALEKRPTWAKAGAIAVVAAAAGAIGGLLR